MGREPAIDERARLGGGGLDGVGAEQSDEFAAPAEAGAANGESGGGT